MTKETKTDTIDDIVTENAWLHQMAMMQRTIQAGTDAEIKRLKDINNSLRRIIAYILMQNNGSYRITRKTLMNGLNFNGDITMEVDLITDDWIIGLHNTKEQEL